MISIVIPVYNAEEGLPQLIHSIFAQTYTDYEVILIDDGSSDKSGTLCDSFDKDNDHVRVYHQSNQGVSAARNFGIKVAAGEFLTFIDADDVVPENYLSELIATQKSTEADIVACDVAVIKDGKESRRFTLSQGVLDQQQALNYLLCRQGINSGPCAKLFRSSLAKKMEFPPLKAYEDILFVKDAFCLTDKIAVTNQTEYRYIQYGDSAMGVFNKEPNRDIITATEILADFVSCREDLSEKCFYITLSHLMQYNQMVQKSGRSTFVADSIRFYRKQIRRILRCGAFPWKEKIVYCLYGMGYKLRGKRLERIGE